MTEDIIYVQLLHEGTVCYRPVPATRTDDGTYILGGEDLYDREDEVWEFAPGTRVHVEKRLLSGGMTMVATAIYACALCRQREVVERGRDRWCAFCRQREMEDRHKQPTVSQTEFVAYLDDVLATLRGRGVTIERGLTEEECTATETH